MTFPSPQMPPAYGAAKPQKLSWVTVPLIIQMVLTALSVVFLPFLIPFFNLATSAALNDPSLAQTDPTTSPETLKAIFTFLSASIWIIEIVTIALLAFYFLTYRAVQQGKSWGRIAAIVLFILALLNFPLGTILGVFGLIGAFDAEVTAYCNR
jgi:type II secretory pathway component PulF